MEPSGDGPVDQDAVPSRTAHPEHGLHLVAYPSGHIGDVLLGVDIVHDLLRDLVDELRVPVHLGVLVVEAVDVGYEHDPLGFEQGCHELHELVSGDYAEALLAIHDDVAEGHGHYADVGHPADRLGIGGYELPVLHDEADPGCDGCGRDPDLHEFRGHQGAELHGIVVDHGGGSHLAEVHKAVLYGVLLREHVSEGARAMNDHDRTAGLGDLPAESGGLLLVELLVLRLVGDDAPAKLDQYHQPGYCVGL